MVHAFAAVGTYRDIAPMMKKRFAGINRLDFGIPIRDDRERGVVREVIQALPVSSLTSREAKSTKTDEVAINRRARQGRALSLSAMDPT